MRHDDNAEEIEHDLDIIMMNYTTYIIDIHFY